MGLRLKTQGLQNSACRNVALGLPKIYPHRSGTRGVMASEQMAEECLLDAFSLHPTREHEIENLQRPKRRSHNRKSDDAVSAVLVLAPEHVFFQLRIRQYFLQLNLRILAPREIQLVGPLDQLRHSLAVGI